MQDVIRAWTALELLGRVTRGLSRLIDESIEATGKIRNRSIRPGGPSSLRQCRPRRATTIDDAPDWEENLFMPAGYTYLGQFAAHDLSFDTTSSLAPQGGSGSATNARTPRFDLDCLYGAGPIDQPYMYDVDRATLLLGRTVHGSDDLMRYAVRAIRKAARAIIGDPRNDENSIICQLHIAFIRFHNEVVKRLDRRSTAETTLFERARNEVRWTYQRILVEDFLPRLVRADVRKDFDDRRSPDREGSLTERPTRTGFFSKPRNTVPLEFSQAAFRFGHSMVRNGYRLNRRRAPVRLFFRGTGATPRVTTISSASSRSRTNT